MFPEAILLSFGATLVANLALLGVLVALFFAVVFGYYTYRGSGIFAHPVARGGDAPGSLGPDEFQAFALRNPEPRDRRPVTDGVHHLEGFPPNAFNVYLIDDASGAHVLVDAATRYSVKRLLREVRGVSLSALVLTHAHPDHHGASKAICRLRDLPLWCGDADADAAESGDPTSLLPDRSLTRRAARFLAGPGHPVARRLREGAVVASFVVLETPGVSPGHISLWREHDRVLLAGDVLANQHPILGRPGLHEPPERVTFDRQANRRSLRRLAALQPSLVCFGHGPPLRDPSRLAEFVAALR
ncbi:MAG: hypothetical protein NVS2B6_04180 [Thermoleophilaceae bacterium]